MLKVKNISLSDTTFFSSTYVSSRYFCTSQVPPLLYNAAQINLTEFYFNFSDLVMATKTVKIEYGKRESLAGNFTIRNLLGVKMKWNGIVNVEKILWQYCSSIHLSPMVPSFQISNLVIHYKWFNFTQVSIHEKNIDITVLTSTMIIWNLWSQ